MSNLTNSPDSGEISGSSGGLMNRDHENSDLQHTNHDHPVISTTSSGQPQPAAAKRKRNLPGTPDPDSEVIALSPRTLLATNRFVCEICNKGFQRDQNLQLHRRGHNLPWKLKQRVGGKEAPQRKRVYVCPEPSCVHHHPSRALGDLTGIKKHFCRKHGEKKWKCDKCSKRYAVQSDWKAHLKTCGTREYRCDCGTLFSRRDSFITHRAFCDALAEESARVTAHRQGEQSGGDPQNGPSGGMDASTIGAPSPPHGANSQSTDAIPSLSEVSKPSMPDSMSDFPLTESGIASLSSKWVHGASSSAAPSKGSSLSLWLGTGPGPGPPGAIHTMKRGVMMPSSRGRNDGGNSGVTGSSELYNEAMNIHKFPSGMVPFSNSTSASGMLANLFASGNNGYSGSQGMGIGGGHNASNAMAGLSSFAGVMNHLDRGRFGSSFGGNMPSTSSMFNQQQHTAIAQLSATALLQKAAQMGATASSPSLFRGFGMGAGDTSSMGHGGGGASARQGPRQDQGRAGLTSIFSSSAMPSYQLMGQAGDHSSNSHGTRNNLGSSSILGHGRSSEGSGVQEFMNSLSGGAGLFGGGLGNPSSLLGSSNNGGHGKGYMQQHAGTLLKHQMMGEKTQDSQSSMFHGRSHFQTGTLRGSSGLGGSESGEDGGGKTTHDFLGVGGISGMAGATTGMGRTLSQKDLASITSLSSGVCRDPFPYQNNSMKTRGARGQSPPGKSWDSS